MQKIMNLLDWRLVEPGKAVNFERNVPRRVRLHVNAPSPASLYYNGADGEIVLLGRVVGRDVIEFAAEGEFAITAEGGDVWFQTIDGEQFQIVIPDPVILTKIIERRARNPEFDRMVYEMQKNMEARMAQQHDELVALFARREADAAAAAAELEAEGDGAGAAGEQSSDVSDDGNDAGNASAA